MNKNIFGAEMSSKEELLRESKVIEMWECHDRKLESAELYSLELCENSWGCILGVRILGILKPLKRLQDDRVLRFWCAENKYFIG